MVPHCLLSIYFSTSGSVLFNSFLPFELAREGIENVTAAKWKKCVDHVIQKVENYYRTSDGVVEQAVERVVGVEDTSDSEEILLGDDENDNND